MDNQQTKQSVLVLGGELDTNQRHEKLALFKEDGSPLDPDNLGGGGGTGSQTPWESDIDADGFELKNLHDPTTAQSAATQAYVLARIAALVASSPSTLDTLNELATALGNDPNFATTITTALGLKAPLASPAFTGNPTAPTPSTNDSDTSLATTAHVHAVADAKVDDASYDSTSWDGVGGIAPSKNAVRDEIETILSAIAAKISDTAYNATSWDGVTTVAPSKNAVRDEFEAILTALASKADSSALTSEAATRAAADALLAPLSSPAFTGNPTAPTPSNGDNDTSIATTAFVTAAVAAEASARSSADTTEASARSAADAALAPLASPTFTGDPKAPTPTPGDNDTSIATTAFVTAAVAAEASARATADGSLAPLASPALTGNPTAPTPSNGDNDTSIATTAFVTAAVAVEAASRATADAALAPLVSPTFTGDPKAPTPATGDNDTSIATTAFVQGALSGINYAARTFKSQNFI